MHIIFFFSFQTIGLVLLPWVAFAGEALMLSFLFRFIPINDVDLDEVDFCC